MDKYKIGEAIEIKKLNIRAYFDENTREIVVVHIDKNANIMNKGLKIGSRINKINGQEIYGVEDFIIKLKEIRENQNVRFSVRDKKEFFDIIIDMANYNEKN